MRRIVDLYSARQRLAPGRGWLISTRRSSLLATGCLAISLVFTPQAIATAGDGDGPELTPPAEMPVVAKPVKPAPIPTRRPATAPGARAVLAVPGLTTPSSRAPATPPSPTPGSALEPIPGGLSLDAPIEMRAAPATEQPVPAPIPGRSPRPLVLESTPVDDEPLPSRGPNTRSNPAPKRSTTTRIDPQPAPSPARRGRLFGLLPAPVQAPQTAPPSSTSRTNLPGRSVANDLPDDPAVESALKRRIERQAREAVGDRVRSVEVRVVGKDATVQARGVKFYQKRAVRKSLEAIPALSGLRSTIEVVD